MRRLSTGISNQAIWFVAEKDAVGESESYRGLGEIYLDIIQPVEALRYLHQAYKALPEGQEEKKGELLYLMSENMINHGKFTPGRAISGFAA